MAKNNVCILVHGAWHGGWAFSNVVKKIKGYAKVLNPDLPGHGSNDLDFKEINLQKYVSHIEEIVKQQEEPVVLVGHSMGGVVISQVAENLPDKVSKLIYVAGFIPEDNGCLLDEEKKASVPSVAKEVKIVPEEAYIEVNKDKVAELFYNKCSPEDVAYALNHFQKQPLQPFADKVSLTQKFHSIPKIYIECSHDNAINIEDQKRMQDYTECEVVAMDSDHSPFLSAETEFVEILGNV